MASGGDISPNLDELFSGNAAKCTAGSGDVCGIVNVENGKETGGWPFTDKAATRRTSRGSPSRAGST